MTKESLFEYPCPECGRGTVRTTRVQNYKTKIRGYPFIVNEALIGVCDQCGAESFAPEETKRWEELFAQSLEARQAFLSPGEISELRKTLNLSMEDFARLVGSTRQSLSMWEKEDRAYPPVRTADLLMKLVRQSFQAGSVNVLSFLLDEARKWGVIIELRRPAAPLRQNGSVVLLPKRRPKGILHEEHRPVALAARSSPEEAQVVVATADGKQIGVLSYDYKKEALVLEVTGVLPPWGTFDVDVETQDGQRFMTQNLSAQEGRLMLLELTKLRESDVSQITLKPHDSSTRW